MEIDGGERRHVALGASSGVRSWVSMSSQVSMRLLSALFEERNAKVAKYNAKVRHGDLGVLWRRGRVVEFWERMRARA
jgi:hypothetical protein